MDIKHLQYFCALAKNEHYGQTAEELGIAQPTLSRIISHMEAELGVYLFERCGRNVRLTKFGKVYYENIQKGLTSISFGTSLVQEMAHPYTGTIDVAFIYTLGPEYIPHLFKKFMAIERNKDFSFNFYQGNTPRIVDNLKKNKFDLALCSYLDDTPELDFIHLFDQELVAIVSTDHPLASKDSISLEEAGEYACILSLDKTGYIDNLFHQKNIKPNIICRVEEDHAIAGLVSVNYGLAILPRNRLLEHYDIKVLSLTDDECIRSIYLALNKDTHLATAPRLFCDFVIHESQQFHFSKNNSND